MTAYLRRSLTAAWRLARFDSTAMHDFDSSFAGFFRSFYAMILCAPLYAIILIGQQKLEIELEKNSPQAANAAATPISPPLEAVLYAINWLAFPIAMIAVARLIGASPRYVPFVVAYNWGTVIVLGMTMLPYVVYLLNILPLLGTLVLYFGVGFFALIYRWRIARDALHITDMTAAAIVILDMLIGIFVGLAAGELRGLVAA